MIGPWGCIIYYSTYFFSRGLLHMRQDKCLRLVRHGSYPKFAPFRPQWRPLRAIHVLVTISTFVLSPLCLRCSRPKDRLYLNSSHMIPRSHFSHLHLSCPGCFYHVRLKDSFTQILWAQLSLLLFPLSVLSYMPTWPLHSLWL